MESCCHPLLLINFIFLFGKQVCFLSLFGMLNEKRLMKEIPGCLSFNRKNRLVEYCSKWGASKPKWKFPWDVRVPFPRTLPQVPIKPKTPGKSRMKQMERKFSVWKFRLGSSDYFSRHPGCLHLPKKSGNKFRLECQWQG